MKNVGYFALSMVTIIAGLVLTAVNPFTWRLDIIVMFIGIFLLVHWKTIGYRWKCDECGEIFDGTFFKNLIGFNFGVNHKLLYCPKCQRRTICKGVPK